MWYDTRDKRRGKVRWGHVQINLFGSFHVERDGKSVDEQLARSPKGMLLMQYLILAPDRRRSKDADAGHVAGGKLNQPRYGAQNAD